MGALIQDKKKNSSTSSCLEFFESSWYYVHFLIQFIIYIGAGLQLAMCFIFFFYIGVVMVVAVCSLFQIHILTGALDFFMAFTGLNIRLAISGGPDVCFFSVMLLLAVLPVIPLLSSYYLCQGLERRLPLLIWPYVPTGLLYLGTRICYITRHEWQDPNDSTVLYCALYALYLLLVTIDAAAIEIVNRRKKVSVVTEIPLKHIV